MPSSGSGFTITGGFTFDTEGLSRGAQKVTREFGTLGTRIAHSFRERIASTIGAAGVTWAIKKELEKAHKVSMESAKFGLNVEEFQTLQHLAEQTGNAVEELAKQFIAAKSSGTEFATEVGAAMKQLRDSGAIMSADDVLQMAKAYQAIAQLQAKAAPLVSGLATGVAGTINDIGSNKGGVGAGIWQNTKDWAKITGGGFMEWMAGFAPEGSKTGEEYRQKGYNLRRSVTANTNADDIEAGNNATETPLEKLIRELQNQAATDAWYKAVGGEENWTSKKEKVAKEKSRAFETSALTGIGGYMQGAAPKSPAETQLELINRKMDDLVASGRKMAA